MPSTKSIPVILLTVYLALGSGAARAAEPGPRIWTSQAGTTVEAEFVGLQQGMVVLRPVVGGELRIRPGDLSAADQAIVTTLAAAADPAAAPSATPAKKPATGNPFLDPSPDQYDPKSDGPVLKTFDFPDYTALVLEKGAVYIYVKEGGAYRSHPFVVRNYATYIDEEIKERRGRAVTAVATPPEIGPNSALLKLNHQHGIYGELFFQFAATEIQMGYHLTEPKDVDPPCDRRWLHIRVPAYYQWDATARLFISPRFPDGLDLPAATARLADADVRFTGPRRDARAYAAATRGMPNDSRRIEIRGPIFTDKTLTFDAPGKNTRLYAWIYADRSPADGFSIFLIKTRPENPAGNRNELVTLTIR